MATPRPLALALVVILLALLGLAAVSPAAAAPPPDADESARIELDERGYAWFANRSAGQYSVKLASQALGERTVEVKAGVKVTRLLF